MDRRGRILLIDKPAGWSSYDVIRVLKREFAGEKIGHAGTLDPMATGLLVALVGEETKRFAEFQRYDKEYEAVVEFGAATDTYDREGRVVARYPGELKLDRTALTRALEKLSGDILQVPPPYSAAKVKGVRAYRLARKGETPALAPKRVEIYRAELAKIEGTRAHLRFLVSSGTYIRSLAHDLGERLGYGAHLVALRRTRIGPYRVEDARRMI